MGSLFKLRDYWSVKVASNEEFDFGLFTTVTGSDGVAKMIVGSHQGVIRVYGPRKKGYKPEDLIVEHVLGVPILQVATGNIGSRGDHAVIVLTPRRLLIGGLVQQRPSEGADGNDPLSSGWSLTFDAEHVLEHTAFNMCVGAFGGQGGQDQVCVQSMDGQLAFFTMNKQSFARYLPSTSFLCPGRLMYVPTIDAFLTGTSTFELQCFRYSTLAQGTASETKDQEALGRKVTPDWSLNLGEEVVDMCCCRLSKGLGNHQLDLVILGEHTIYLLKQDTGEMRWNKRIDCSPSCIMPYQLPGKHGHNIVIGTYDNQLLIMNDRQLVWSAKTAHVPLGVSIGKACKVDGMVLMLTDDGTLSVNYLGTDPASDPVKIIESKEFDYEAMDEEQRRLQQVIRQAVNSNKTEPKETIALSCDPPALEGRVATVMVNLAYSGTDDIENVVLTVNSAAPIVPLQATTVIEMIPQGQSVSIPVQFGLSPEADRFTPTSLIADIYVCYHASGNGEALTTRSQVVLPLAMVGAACPPLKSNAFVVQVDTDQQAFPLNELFADLGADVQPNVISFTYNNGGDVTIIASKNGGRYRILGSQFESLWLLSSELTRRLKAAFKARGVEVNVSAPDNLPLPAFFQAIDNHFAARMNVNTLQQELGELAHQFRAIQKRLLVRFRDKNPTPLTSMETLFEHTHRRLHGCADRIEEAQRDLEQRGNALSCATHMIIFLSRYHYQHFQKEDIDVLRHYLSPVVLPGQTTMGWEEITDASMTHLLRTSLSKSSKESASAPQPLTTPEDTGKLKKHLTIVFDRIGKGGIVREVSKKDNVTVAEGKKKKRAPE